MADVYEACALALKPGGFLVSVTKDMRSAGGGAPGWTPVRTARSHHARKAA
jgi:hypothetical protein